MSRCNWTVSCWCVDSIKICARYLRNIVCEAATTNIIVMRTFELVSDRSVIEGPPTESVLK